jgi:hypothetical protein
MKAKLIFILITICIITLEFVLLSDSLNTKYVTESGIDLGLLSISIINTLLLAYVILKKKDKNLSDEEKKEL